MANPFSTLGLYTDESPGLKVDPVVVLVLSLVFIFSVVALHSKLLLYDSLVLCTSLTPPQSLQRSRGSSRAKLSRMVVIAGNGQPVLHKNGVRRQLMECRWLKEGGNGQTTRLDVRNDATIILQQ